MKSKLVFSWDITLLLVIASFVYVCFDKVIALLALMAVSRDHPTMDMVPLLNNLTSLNGGYSEKLMGLVGTFFTIVLAGNMFKNQQGNGQEGGGSNSTTSNGGTIQKSSISPPRSNTAVEDSSESKRNEPPSSSQPLITKIPE